MTKDEIRERLVELLREVQYLGGLEEKIADRLVAHGVTVQEWIPVSERLPQQDEPTGVMCEIVQVLLSDGIVTVGWCNREVKMWYFLPCDETRFTGDVFGKTPVVAWQPLSAPPKENDNA